MFVIMSPTKRSETEKQMKGNVMKQQKHFRETSVLKV